MVGQVGGALSASRVIQRSGESEAPFVARSRSQTYTFLTSLRRDKSRHCIDQLDAAVQSMYLPGRPASTRR